MCGSPEAASFSLALVSFSMNRMLLSARSLYASHPGRTHASMHQPCATARRGGLQETR
jgi:hypothetical protein